MSSRSSIADPAPTRSRRRRWGFRLGAVMLGVLPFVILELGLRVAGLSRLETGTDPLAGFGNNYPLFVREGDVWRTARAREPFFPPQEFSAAKPTNGFRIFCFGGSTVYGHPYEWPTSFPKWLELELAAGDPAHTYQSINCGGVSYASYRLLPIVREVLAHQPDLVILATGHNEFLEDRTYRSVKNRSPLRAALEDRMNSLRLVTLARSWFRRPTGAVVKLADGGGESSPLSQEIKVRLDDRSGYASYHRDDAWRAQVTAQYEDSVRAMVKMCQDARVPVVLVKLGSNLRDCPPYKSEHKPGLAPGQEMAWQSAFDAGTRAEERDLRDALAAYQKAANIDDEHALLSWRTARALDRLGQKSEAARYYLRAKEEDVCPLRILTAFEHVLEKLSADTRVPLVDAAGLFIALSPDGIPGNDWYLDHVHPTIGAHQRIAQAIATHLRSHRLTPEPKVWTTDARRTAFQQHLSQLSPTYISNGRRRVEWLETWARRERLSSETAPKDARGHLHLGFRKLELGDEIGAQAALQEALRLEPTLSAAVGDRTKELRSQGRDEAASALETFVRDALIKAGPSGN